MSIPKFFGEKGRELFGVYHPPLVGAAPAGVVLCNAGPQEYRHMHWSFRKLAVMLAAAGLHVLRFDYFATGDSAGAAPEGTLAQWTEDIGTAARELVDLADLRRVSLVGMRLGASLAARASAGGLKVKELVLWEPVISGRHYLTQLEAVQARMLFALHYPQLDHVGEDELLGYPLPAAMRNDLANIDLTRGDFGVPERTLLLSARERPGLQALHARLRDNGANAALRVVPDPELYGGTNQTTDTLLAHDSLAAIVDFLTRRDQ